MSFINSTDKNFRLSEFRLSNELKLRIPWRLALILLIFTFAIIYLGIYYYKSQRTRILDEQETALSAIARLKIEQIVQWHTERLGDASAIMDNGPLVYKIKQFFTDRNETINRRELNKWIGSIYKYYDYSGVLLADTSLKVRLSVVPSDTVAGDLIRDELRNAIRKNAIVLTDLHKSENISYVHLDLIIPLTLAGNMANKPFGLIILRIDPEKLLFPLIKSWPVPSKSAETLLLRKDGDSVLYLNNVRHQNNNGFNMRRPLSDKSLLSAKAGNGYEGVTEGTDYRNKPVVGYLSRIPDLPWYMVAKVDKDEIQEQLKSQIYITILGAFLLILIIASIFGFWIRDQQIRLYRKKLKDEAKVRESEEKLRNSEERFRTLYENVTIGIYRTTIDGQILMANPAMVKMLGFDSFEELAQRNLEVEGYDPDFPRSKFLETILKEGKIHGLESAWHDKHGKVILVRENASAVKDEYGQILYFDGTVEDITEGKKTETALLESEQKFHDTIINLDEGYYSVTMDGLLLDHNQAFNRIMGFDVHEDLRGSSLPDFWQHSEERDVYLKELIAEGAITNYLINAKKKSNEKVYVLASAHMVRDKENHPVRIEGVFLDITERIKAEEALRSSQLKYQELFENAQVGMYRSKLDGSLLIAVNTKLCEIFGYSEKEMLENPATIRWADPVFRDQMILELNQNGTLQDYRIDIVTKNGEIRTCSVSVRMNREKDYIEGSATDITDSLRAEELLKESEEKFRGIFESNLLGTIFWDANGEIVAANDAFLDIVGYSQEDLRKGSLKWDDLTPAKYHEIDKGKLLELSIKGRIDPFEKEYIHKSGRLIPIIISAATLSGSGTNGVAIILDMTPLKRAEEEIRTLNEELEKKVITRTEQLEAANRELEAFSYSVSHDLRSPLRAVHSYTNILMEEYGKKLDEEGMRICGIISSSAIQMGGLIDDLLSFSRIGKSNLNPVLLEMKPIAESGFTAASGENGNKNTKFNICKLHKANGDPVLIRLVWNNLMSNAIKYSSKKKNPEITVGSVQENGFITYSVQDNGVGFDMQYVHKLFGVFQRLHSESEFEGNGVGLAIVRRIIMKHNGKVWAEGEVGKGATFYFSLPRNNIHKTKG